MLKRGLHSYGKVVCRHPWWVVLFWLAIAVACSFTIKQFRLDASSDSLVLENDQALKTYREMAQVYGSSDFLVMTYAPEADLFSDESLLNLQSLRQELQNVDGIDSITSILNVPLTQSPPMTLTELREQQRYLLDAQTNRQMAKKELQQSPIYKNLLVSPEADSTAMLLLLKSNQQLTTVFLERNELREKSHQQALSQQQQQRLQTLEQEYQTLYRQEQAQQAELIKNVRKVMSNYRQGVNLFLGGVPMIISDSINYIRSDLWVFGTAALLLIILVLSIAFRNWVWVTMPLVTCLTSGYLMLGFLGFIGWPISVVSANFLSLLLIITLSISIHMIVRFRELSTETDASVEQLMWQTMQSKFVPCFYTAITTMVAFASLIISGIRPVIDFGWMMCVGITLSMVLCFSLFPALICIFKPKSGTDKQGLIVTMAKIVTVLVRRYRFAVLTFFGVLLAFSVFGISKLTVENRFIDYFKPSTEIYQGMSYLDQKFGGTTPLEVIIDAPDSFFEQAEEIDEFDAFLLGEEESSSLTVSSYWFNQFKLQTVAQIHKDIDTMTTTGKVLSVASALEFFENLEGVGELNNFELGLLYENLPKSIKETLFTPYMAEDGNQIRISVRVFESDKELNRDQLIADIERLLIEKYQLNPEQVTITGLLVLYNNMLHSLFDSQIKTLAAVFLAIFLMFIVLFRNFMLALTAIIPNILSALFVLSVMGWFRIPLDLMTITIAAISMGIAVDNSIHYVHRFRDEFASDHNYVNAIVRSNHSIGKAMYYTSIVITLGFMVLVFSNFVPTIYFGALTGVAMLTALMANLTLLPALLRVFKPCGPNDQVE